MIRDEFLIQVFPEPVANLDAQLGLGAGQTRVALQHVGQALDGVCQQLERAGQAFAEFFGGDQLAYGHNRLAALRENGDESAEFIVKPLSDYDMLVAMIDENATQRNQTTLIMFENVTAALRLGEKLILESENVNEFNVKANPSVFRALIAALKDSGNEPHYRGENLEKASRCYLPNSENEIVTLWRDVEFCKAKESIASGEGLGRGFLQHFLPSGVQYTPATLQNAIDSYYAESRKAAAKRKAEEAAAEAKAFEEKAAIQRAKAEAAAKAEAEARAKQESERRAREQAEAQVKAAKDEAERARATEEATRRAKAEAEAKRQAESRAAAAETHRKAEAKTTAKATEAKATEAKAKKEGESIDSRGFDRSLLEQLPSLTHMQQLITLARAERIPSQFHAALVKACIDEGWTTSTTGGAKNISHSIANAGRVWWFKASGRAEKERQAAGRESLKWKNREKTLDEFVRETITDGKNYIKALDAIKQFADQIENPTLASSFHANLGAVISVTVAVRDLVKKPVNVVPIDAKRLESM